jgi:hypothetical protein
MIERNKGGAAAEPLSGIQPYGFEASLIGPERQPKDVTQRSF